MLLSVLKKPYIYNIMLPKEKYLNIFCVITIMIFLTLFSIIKYINYI